MSDLVDLDTLLEGNPTWDEVVAFWKDGEWHEEQYLVQAIKKHIRTEAQRKLMYDHDLSIEDILNGRYVYGGQTGKAVKQILKEWNKKLGFKAFGE